MGHFRKQCISFLVSSECNLNCVYCYIPHWGNRVAVPDRVLDVEFAVAAMKEFFSWSPIKGIRFFSAGEATMQFDRMLEIHEAAKQLAGDELRVELQTNGYFDDAVADWIAKHVHVLWISCDGPPELQDAQRPTVDGGRSSDIVLRQVRRFTKEPNMQFGVRATFLPEHFDRQIEVLDYFRELGLKYVCGAPAYSSTVNDHTPTPILLNFAKAFVPAFNHAREIGMFYQTHLMVNFDEPVTAYCRACTTPICPQLTSDGYVSCCDWASFGPDYLPGILQECIYGKWDPEQHRIVYFPERAERISNRNVEHLRIGPCEGCEIVEHCAAGCIGKVMVRSGALDKIDPNWCAAVLYLARHIPRNTGIYPVRHS